MKSVNFVRRTVGILFTFLIINSFSFVPNAVYAAPDGQSESGATQTTVYFRSIGEYDGWTEEQYEDSNKGTSSHNRYEYLWVGDDANDNQFRGILSFNTATLPDNKTMTSATLQLKYYGKVGTLPFITHNGLYLDVKTPAFGSALDPFGGALGLFPSDFEAGATKSSVAKISATPVDGWYSATILGQYISKTTTTQFRIRFAKGDNDDQSSDMIGFYQGNASVYANRPRLLVRYIP